MRPILVVLLLIACAGPAKVASPMPSATVPFFVSSMRSSYAVRGEFWGRIGQDPSGLQIEIDSLAIGSPPPQYLTWDHIRIRPLLAFTTSGGHWDIRTQGSAITLTSLPPLRDSVLGRGRLTLAIPKGFDASRDYLAFQFEFPDPTNSHQTSTTYACGYPGMLVGDLPTKAFPIGNKYVDEC